MTDAEQIASLPHGKSYTIPESDYGKAEVWRINDRYFLFEIPMFGGPPSYTADYAANESGIKLLLDLVESWT